MRVAMFSSKPYDRRSFEERNGDFGHELHFLEPRLGAERWFLTRSATLYVLQQLARRRPLMPRAYRQLDLDERRTIFRLLNAKVPMTEIAQQLGRHRSTIHREMSRNHFREQREYAGYFPLTAQDCARQRRQRLSKLHRYEVLRRYIIDKLEHCWSPEQIAGRLRLDRESGATVCHETTIASSMARRVVLPAFTVICRKPAASDDHATVASLSPHSFRLPAPLRSGHPRSNT